MQPRTALGQGGEREDAVVAERGAAIGQRFRAVGGDEDALVRADGRLGEQAPVVGAVVGVADVQPDVAAPDDRQPRLQRLDDGSFRRNRASAQMESMPPPASWCTSSSAV